MLHCLGPVTCPPTLRVGGFVQRGLGPWMPRVSCGASSQVIDRQALGLSRDSAASQGSASLHFTSSPHLPPPPDSILGMQPQGGDAGKLPERKGNQGRACIARPNPFSAHFCFFFSASASFLAFHDTRPVSIHGAVARLSDPMPSSSTSPGLMPISLAAATRSGWHFFAVWLRAAGPRSAAAGSTFRRHPPGRLHPGSRLLSNSHTVTK